MSSRALILGLALAGAADVGHADAVLNRDYTLVTPAQRTDSAGKIEVIEFFSYGCPHCADLHPRVTAWAGKLPKDTVFKRVPVGFGRTSWTNFAKTYYALESLAAVDKVDVALYDAVHKQRLPLADEPSITAWMAKRGVDAAKFKAAFNSFSVHNQVARADEMSRNYRVSEVPTFAVAGRFAVIGRTEDQVFATTDALIAKARAEKLVAR